MRFIVASIFELNPTPTMIIATIYFVVISILSLVLIPVFKTWYQKMSVSENRYLSRFGTFLYVREGAGFLAALLIWILAVLGLPLVYEFGPIFKNGYVIFFPEDENKPIEMRRLPWYGAIQDPLTNAYCFYTPEGSYNFTTFSRKFTVTDAKKDKVVEFEIQLNVEYPKFIYEIARVQKPHAVDLQNELMVFNNLGCVFQQADVPVEELPGHAVSLAEKWLQDKKISSATVKLVKAYSLPNPERTVQVR